MTTQPWGCFIDGQPPSSGGTTTQTNLGFLVERATNQTLSPGSNKVLFDNIIEENPAGTFDLVNDRFVVTIPGRYTISFSATQDFNGFIAYAEAAIFLNGSTLCVERSEVEYFDVTRDGLSVEIQLAVNDVIEAYVWNGDVFNTSLRGGSNKFSAALIVTP